MSNVSELITIVVPVKNEERNLPECLENVKAFRHVVVVDSGSTDRTLEIAAEFGREVVQFKWNGEFPKKRNWLLRNYKFKTSWVMFLDADERLTPGFCDELGRVLPETKCNAFICFYDNWFMDRMLRHGDAMRKTAILRLGTGEYEKIDEHGWSSLDMEIHEHLQVEGEVGVIKARLEHQALKGDFSKLTRRQRIKYTLIRQWWFGFAYFCACYFLKLGILDGKHGYVFARGKWKYFANIRKKILGAE